MNVLGNINIKEGIKRQQYNNVKPKKIWICLKPKKSEPAWRRCLARSGELAPPHSSSADVSQSIVNISSLRSRYDVWRNHDILCVLMILSMINHNTKAGGLVYFNLYSGKIIEENTGNKRRKIDQDKENTWNTWNTWNTKREAVSFVPICIQEKGPVVVQQAAAAPSLPLCKLQTQESWWGKQ